MKELGSVTRPDQVKLPPYYPNDPVILDDWAQYLDACRYTDREVGEVIARLEKEKILDQTVIFFMTEFLYDEGIHVPFVVRGPGIPAGATRDDLVQHIDMTAASLTLAGIPIPKTMQGRNVFAPDYRKRNAVFAARDRCDETVERIRCVRTERFKYIRNFYPERPHLQPNAYKDNKAIVKRLRQLHQEKKLDAVQELIFAPTRPKEELYDLQKDPSEINNLALDPAYKQTLAELRQSLEVWMEETDDRGRTPESAKMYDSDMKVYIDGKGTRNPERIREFEANIALMKKWASEGK
jgi:arylsulfatase A-like enzyme